jgi:hypothetical protein
MSELHVVQRGDHCEIFQGDAIAADYVASTRLARMFAAAPDLLAALKDLLVKWESAIDYEPDYMDMGDKARAAIAKAEGRAE